MSSALNEWIEMLRNCGLNVPHCTQQLKTTILLTCIQINEKNVMTVAYRDKKDVKKTLVLEAPSVIILR